MGKLIFHRYRLGRLISIRDISTVHYLSKTRHYDVPPHSHNLWEIVFCNKGSVTVWDDVNRIELSPGEIYFLQPRIIHHMHVFEEPSELFVMSFACTNECMKLFHRKWIKTDADQRAILTLMIQEIKSAFELNEQGELQLGEFHPSASAPVGAEQLICGFLEWLLISLLRNGMDVMHNDAGSAVLEETLQARIMTEIKAYVDAHLGERITIAQLSQHVHYSRTHITVQFKAATGMSIMDYVESRRIERAKEQLVQGDLSVSQVADGLGFTSLQYFSRRFRMAVGCSPSRYADSLDNVVKLPFATQQKNIIKEV